MLYLMESICNLAKDILADSMKLAVFFHNNENKVNIID